MYWVYVLQNEQGKLYIGFTNDLRRRSSEHRSGQVYSTSRMGGIWRLIYCEGGFNQADTFRRERFLKSGPGKAFIKKRIKYALK